MSWRKVIKILSTEFRSIFFSFFSVMQIRRVTIHRGSHLPKRKDESNSHPTYEISVRFFLSV
jgi:hypothetical protein